MAHYDKEAGFPGIKLLSGMKIVLEARSPTTNATVAGAKASLWSIYGDDVSDALLEDVVPVYSLEGDEDAGLGTPSA